MYKELLSLLIAAALGVPSLAGCNPPAVEPQTDKETPGDVTPGPDTPDTPPPPEIPVDPALGNAQWYIDESEATASVTAWQTDNKLPCRRGTYAGTAFLSTESGGHGSEPRREVRSNRIVASHFNEDDAFVFTVPSVSLAAGSSVDFSGSFYATSADAPLYWIFEYKDGNDWKSVEKDLYAVPGTDKKYSFPVKYFSASEYTTFVQSFTLEHAIQGGDLVMRCRVAAPVAGDGSTLSPNASAYVGLVNATWVSANIGTYQAIPVKDTRRMLILGNSFTYYYGPVYMLKELARSQGHDIQLRAFVKGNQYFRDFQHLELAQNVIREGRYAYALLQDASMQHAYYFNDARSNAPVYTETEELFNEVRQYSPGVRLVLESTWAYSYQDYKGFGSFEAFDDANIKGTTYLCDKLDAWLSPIGLAFKKARESGFTDLYHTDNHHPNRNGAYLKSCVNYLLLYGERFDANVSDCTLDAKTAARLRSIAEEVVLGALDTYRNPDATGLVPGGSGSQPDPSETVDGNHGIENAAQLVSWAVRTNTGGDVSSYKDASGAVVLLQDIDLTGVTWPVVGLPGGALANGTKIVPTVAFTGVFDGKGHTIKGLALVHETDNKQVTGFFGATSNAIVRNVDFTGCTVDFSSKELNASHVAVATVAAYAHNTVFENINVEAAFSGEALSASSINVSVGGVVGMMYADAANAGAIRNCTFSGSIKGDIGVKYSTSNTGKCAGIVAGVSSASSLCLIKDCENRAEIAAGVHRAAGIVCDGFCSLIEGCINNGAITVNQSAKKASGSSKGVRLGGILAYCTTTTVSGSHLDGCRNNGRIVTTEASSAAGGVVGAIKCYDLKNCINTGDVVCPEGQRGLLIGMINKNTVECTLSSCFLKGSIGAKVDGSDAVAATPDNCLSLGVTLYNGATCKDWNATNIKYFTE